MNSSIGGQLSPYKCCCGFAAHTKYEHGAARYHLPALTLKKYGSSYLI